MIDRNRTTTGALCPNRLGIGALFERLRDAIVVADASGRIRLWNPAASRMFGYAPDEVVGSDAELLVAEEVRPQFRTAIVRRSESSDGELPDADEVLELPALHRDGGQLQVELTLSSIDGSSDGERLVLAVIRDATSRRLLEAALVQRTFHDQLTDLPNRMLFLDTLERGLRSAHWRHEQIAVLVVDLAGFAEVRAALGDRAANDLLAMVGERLGQSLSAEDLAARLDADVFGIVLRSVTNAEAAETTADRVLDLLQTPFAVDGHRVVLSAAIGIALNDSPGATHEDLLRHAELALQEAKHAGAPSRHRFEAGITPPVSADELDLVGELRLALERDEFELHWQPIMRLANGALYGVEAFVRWRHPQRGLLPASAVIGPAERHGLIAQIDGWVLREACRQGAGWQTQFPADPPLLIAVNVSAGECGPGLLDRVASALATHPLAGESLMLELTETARLADLSAVATVFGALRERGIRIGLDDFGSGDHALSYLRHLPLDAIKLDQSFIAALDDGRTATIVAAVIELAHRLGLDVIGEGIETDAQAQALRQLGCELGQGHRFAAAMEATAIPALLAARSLSVAG